MNVQDLVKIKEDALAEATAATDAQALEAVRIKYLGRKGIMIDVMANIKSVPNEDKRAYGQNANAIKTELGALIESRKGELEGSGDTQKDDGFDLTRPGEWNGLGKQHPISQIINRINEIFQTLGFSVADGPDIETVFNNFDALNTPADHPSRDMQDTFYLNSGDLMRCHTSPVQTRYMLKHKPPIRIIAPAAATAATHRMPLTAPTSIKWKDFT